MTDSLEPTRRDFLAASAAGLLGLASSTTSLARGEKSQPDGALLYVGTYTEGGREEGIYLIRMDPRSGELRMVGSVNAGANPSFLTIHPNGRVLYAVNETTESNGAVSAFAMARDTGGPLPKDRKSTV